MSNAASPRKPPANGKAKLTPVAKPDLEAYKERERVATEAMNELRKKMEELGEKIGGRMGGRDEYSRKRDELRTRLDEITAQLDALEKERTHVQDEIDKKRSQGRDLKVQAQTMRRNLTAQTTEEIQAQISELEMKYMKSSSSVQEERKMIAKISELKASMPLVGKVAAMESAASGYEGQAITPFQVRLDQVRDEITKLREAKRTEGERLRNLTSERQRAMAPVRDLVEERDNLFKQLTEKRQELSKVRNEREVENRLFMAYQAQLKKVKQEQAQEERKRRQLENEKKELELELEQLEDPPLSDEMYLLQQTFKYLTKLIDQTKNKDDKEGTEETKKENDEESAKMAALAAEEGQEILVPKSQREEKFFFAPTKKSGKKGGHKAGKKGGAKGKQALTMDIRMISDFKELKMEPPYFLDDCPSCAEKIEARIRELELKENSQSQGTKERREQVTQRLAVVKKLIEEEMTGKPAASKTPETTDCEVVEAA